MPEQLRLLFRIKVCCPNCNEKGHSSHIPSLRACNTCLDEGLKYYTFLVIVVFIDCEECNKKALLTLNCSAKDETLPAELTPTVALPDVVHLGSNAAGLTGSLTLRV